MQEDGTETDQAPGLQLSPMVIGMQTRTNLRMSPSTAGLVELTYVIMRFSGRPRFHCAHQPILDIGRNLIHFFATPNRTLDSLLQETILESRPPTSISS